MVEKIHSGRDFGDSECLKGLPLWKRVCGSIVLLLLGLCLVGESAGGQSAQSSVQAYAEAVKQSVISERIVAMEHYLTLLERSHSLWLTLQSQPEPFPPPRY